MRFNSLVLQEQRHLKWRALDPLENLLMILCGISIAGFSVVVLMDVILRTVGHPWFLAQEATMAFFLYGIFFGVAAATRRNDHLYLAVLAEFDDRWTPPVLRNVQPCGRSGCGTLHDLFRLS